MIDFNSGALKKANAFPDLNEAAARIGKSEQKRDYLGGSRLGEQCARKLQYEFFGTPSERPRDAKTMMIFATGHALEAEVCRLLRGAGIQIKTHDTDGAQYGFSVADGLLRGHVDGIICDGPSEFGPYPYIFENKAVGAKYWNAIVKKGVTAERPVYAAQIAIYQAYMKVMENPALFCAVNRDTGEVFFERVPFNAKLAQEASDRGVAVIQACKAGELLPRAYTSADYFECRFCDYAKRCWV